MTLLGAPSLLTTLRAADVTWDNGASDGLWTSAVNWNPSDTLPGDADTAIIGGTGNIDATGAATIDALRITRAVTISNGTITMDAVANQSGGNGIFQTNPGGASNNVTIGSNLSFTGSTVSGTISMIRVDGQGTTTINGTVTNASNLGQPGSKLIDFSGGIGVGQTATLIFNGAITSTRTTGQTEMEINRGTVELNAANSFTNAGSLRFIGGVTTGTGTLKLGHATALGNSSFSIGGGDGGLAGNTYTAQVLQTGTNTVANAITIRNAGANNVLGADIASGTATYSGALTLQNVTSGTAGAIILKSVQTGGTVAFSGLISNAGAGAVVRDLTIGDATTGLGTVGFTRADGNTYTGNTTIAGGLFLANNTAGSATGTGLVTVSSGATLGGTGSISGATTVSGNLNAGIGGSTTETLGFGSTLNLASAQTTTFNVASGTRGSGYDGIDVAGALTNGGALSINFGSSFLAGGETFDLFGGAGGNAGSTGTFASVTISGSYTAVLSNNSGIWTGSGNGYNFTYTQSTGDLIVSAIPEPSTFAAIAGLGVLGLATLRRRRVA